MAPPHADNDATTADNPYETRADRFMLLPLPFSLARLVAAIIR